MIDPRFPPTEFENEEDPWQWYDDNEFEDYWDDEEEEFEDEVS